MFNRPNVHLHEHRSTVHHGPVHHHEHRAPTDESVRLLMDMEEAARAKIVHTAVLNDMPMACTIFVMRHCDGTVELQAIYDINGKRHTTQVRDAIHDTDRFALVKKLHEAIARQVSELIIMDGLTAVDWPMLTGGR